MQLSIARRLTKTIEERGMLMDNEKEFYRKLAKKGVNRRDFMRYCTFLTATMGLSSSFVPKVAEVFAAPKQRPPVIWLHFGECTGCSEAVLRAQYPYVDVLVLEVLVLEYHETIMAAAGHQAEDNLAAAVKKYEGEIYLCGGRRDCHQITMADMEKSAIGPFLKSPRKWFRKPLLPFAIGACASFGGIPAAQPNPGGYKSVSEAIGMKDIEYSGLPRQTPSILSAPL